MKHPAPFFKLAVVDVCLIAEQLSSIGTGIWLSNQVRQQRFAVHQATQSIFLLYDKGAFLQNPHQHPAYALLKTALQVPVEQLEEHCLQHYGKGNIARMLLVNLRANQTIAEHQDSGEIFKRAHRLHIPIQTNNQVVFTVHKQQKCLKQGEVWEINNGLTHSVANNSVEDRIHLIIDWLVY